MKITTTKTTMTFFSILAIITTGLLIGTTAIVPSVFAETMVSLPVGSSAPGCETTNECYIPYEASIGVGHTVTWSNDDTAAHTVTSGSASGGPDGVFDSNLFAAGTTFSHTFEEEGTFDYFCMVHPWMVGSVMVETAMAAETGEEVMHEEDKTSSTETKMMATESAISNIDATEVKITLDHDITGGKVLSVSPDTEASSLIITLETTESGSITMTLPRDVIDAKIGDEDDAFFVLVDGEEVEFEEASTDMDRTLTIMFPAGVDKIEIIGTFVVPEFGTITMMILAVAIISIVAVSSKSRLSIMPRL